METAGIISSRHGLPYYIGKRIAGWKIMPRVCGMSSGSTLSFYISIRLISMPLINWEYAEVPNKNAIKRNNSFKYLFIRYCLLQI